MHIHHVADDERGAFMAAQNAGREGPGDLEMIDVLTGDLAEGGIALAIQASRRRGPVLAAARGGVAVRASALLGFRRREQVEERVQSAAGR